MPELFDRYDYAAQEFDTVGRLERTYTAKGWAAPISGDATTIQDHHDQEDRL